MVTILSLYNFFIVKILLICDLYIYVPEQYIYQYHLYLLSLSLSLSLQSSSCELKDVKNEILQEASGYILVDPHNNHHLAAVCQVTNTPTQMPSSTTALDIVQ